jgi:hypothetical protein
LSRPGDALSKVDDKSHIALVLTDVVMPEGKSFVSRMETKQLVVDNPQTPKF